MTNSIRQSRLKLLALATLLTTSLSTCIFAAAPTTDPTTSPSAARDWDFSVTRQIDYLGWPISSPLKPSLDVEVDGHANVRLDASTVIDHNVKDISFVRDRYHDISGMVISYPAESPENAYKDATTIGNVLQIDSRLMTQLKGFHDDIVSKGDSGSYVMLTLLPMDRRKWPRITATIHVDHAEKTVPLNQRYNITLLIRIRTDATANR